MPFRIFFGSLASTEEGPTEFPLTIGLLESSRTQAQMRFTDPLAIQLADLVRELFVTARVIDALPVGLVEQFHVLAFLSAADTLPIGLAESATAGPTEEVILIATSESLRVQLIETTQAIRAILSRVDLLPVGLTETLTMHSALTPRDALPVNVIDLSSIHATLLRGDPLTVGTVDSVALHATLIARDLFGCPLIDALRIVATLAPRLDTLPIGLVEVTSIVSDILAVEASDTLALTVLAVTQTIRVFLNPQDATRIGLVDSTALHVALTVRDLFECSLLDAFRIVAVLAPVLDTLPIGLEEVTNIAADILAVEATDTLALTVLSATQTIRVLLNPQDTMRVVALDDSPRLLAAMHVGETFACSLADALRVIALLERRADSLPIALTEFASIVSGILTVDASDVLAIGLSEQSRDLFAVLRVADSFDVNLGESANILARLAPIADVLKIDLLDVANLMASLVVLNDCPIDLAERAALAALLAVNDTERVGVVEGRPTILALLRPGDTAQMGLGDVLRMIAALQASDTIGLLSDESAQPTPTVIGRDSVVIQLGEQAVLITTLVTLGHVIVATVTSLLPPRTVEAVRLVRTVRPSGWVHTLEVL